MKKEIIYGVKPLTIKGIDYSVQIQIDWLRDKRDYKRWVIDNNERNQRIENGHATTDDYTYLLTMAAQQSYF